MKKIISVIVTSVVSVVLFLSLVIASFSFSTKALMKEESLAVLLKNMDYSLFFTDEQMMELVEMPIDGLTIYTHTKAGQEIIDLYAHDLFIDMFDIDEKKQWTVGNTNKVVMNNIDELKDLTLIYLEASNVDISNMTDTQLNDQTVSLFMHIFSNLPTASRIEEVFPGLLDMYKPLYRGKVAIPFIIIAIILSLCVFFLRNKKKDGTLWLAIVYVINGLFIYRMSHSMRLVSLQESSFMPIIVNYGLVLLKCSIVSLVIALGFFIVFVLIKKYKKSSFSG